MLLSFRIPRGFFHKEKKSRDHRIVFRQGQFLTCMYLATAFPFRFLRISEYASPRKMRDRERGEKVVYSRARNEERRRHRPTGRLVLHFIAQYVTACSVGRCICPAVLWTRTHVFHDSRPCLLSGPTPCGSTTPVPVDQFLSRQSRPSSRLQRRGSERWSASQSISHARDGIDAVHRTAKVMHRTRVRAHGRRGRCTLHTANLSRRSTRHRLVSRLLRMRKDVVRRRRGTVAPFAVVRRLRRAAFSPLAPSVTSLGGISRGRGVRGTGRGRQRRDSP